MATRRLSGMTTSSSVPDNGGDHSGGGGEPRPPAGGYVDDVFSTYLYTGNTEKGRDIVNGIDLDGEGGLVWIKARGNKANGSASSHILTDTERGLNSALSTNKANGESLEYQQVTAFNNNGFTIDDASEVNMGDFNGWPAIDYVSWTFRKAPSFFDVVTYTGNGVRNRQIPHGLGIEPGMIIVKSTTRSDDWYVWHKGLPNNGIDQRVYLNKTLAASTEGDPFQNFPTLPTDSVFYIGLNSVNLSSEEYVAYVFAHDDSEEGMIQCGGISGSGSVVDVDLGWEPQFVLWKRSTAVDDWFITDSMRGFTVTSDAVTLRANVLDKEGDNSRIKPTSTGFTFNPSNDDFIYMAIRRPNKPAEEFEPDELFAMDENINGVINPAYRTSPEWPVDFSLFRAQPLASANINAASRLMAPNFLKTNLNEVEEALTGGYWDYMNGWRSTSPAGQLAWMWRRAQGFFDVVAYEGIGGSQEVPHGLGVVPEMMWVKRRTTDPNDWEVYHSGMSRKEHLRLNTDAGKTTGSPWTALPTETEFSVNGSQEVNRGGDDYIAYLWASVPGICDIGTYTGDTSTNSVMVDCGFTNGPRFVLIKRTDANGDWMYWDSLRGLGFSGNPMLKLNDTDAQVANDYIQAESYGFRARKGEPTNIDGAEYIYMAIA